MLNDNEKLVLKTITEWSEIDDGIWFGMSQLSDDTNIPINEVKKICKKLRGEGLIQLETLYDSDGVYGSGYFTPCRTGGEQ